MNEDDILKYIASNDELLQSCNNLFEGQSKIFSGENNYIENFFIYLVFLNIQILKGFQRHDFWPYSFLNDPHFLQ